MSFNILNCRNALVVGAGHGISLAVVQYLLEKVPNINITATYRLNSSAEELFQLKELHPQRLQIVNIDPTKESHLQELAIDLKSQNIELDLIFNGVGILHDQNLSPEKSLKSFSADDFMKVIMVNAVVTPLIAKYFEKLLINDSPSALISLSAKVGSIDDNRMGGWYSYRASKAALNMLIKNIAIEFNRKKLNCLVLAIHPGTTKTQLSSPYIKNSPYIIHETLATASNIFSVINNKTSSQSGKFFSWDGSEIPW